MLFTCPHCGGQTTCKTAMDRHVVTCKMRPGGQASPRP